MSYLLLDTTAVVIENLHYKTQQRIVPIIYSQKKLANSNHR
jgi:hypothetical protein